MAPSLHARRPSSGATRPINIHPRIRIVDPLFAGAATVGLTCLYQASASGTEMEVRGLVVIVVVFGHVSPRWDWV
jgi:hypothetical protein